MLRDKNLIPLSHQHHNALALCVFIKKAFEQPHADLARWQREIVDLWTRELAIHFEAEEQVIFPAAKAAGMETLVGELLGHHTLLTARVLQARRGEMSADDLSRFAAELTVHVRKEENELFEELQRRLSSEQLAQIGAAVERWLNSAGGTCSLPKRE